MDSLEGPPKQQTWNDAQAIEQHRRMSAAECVMAAISLSRAALLFAGATRHDGLDAMHGPDEQ